MANQAKGGSTPLPPESASRPARKPGLGLVGISQHFLEKCMLLLYTIIGLSLLLVAILILVLVFWGTGSYLLDISAIAAQNSMPVRDVVKEVFVDLISGLLFVLVILGLLSTIVNYLKNGMTSLRPFLYAGILGATRGILSVGFRLSLERDNPETFMRAMIELGVNAGIILLLAISLALISKVCETPGQAG